MQPYTLDLLQEEKNSDFGMVKPQLVYRCSGQTIYDSEQQYCNPLGLALVCSLAVSWHRDQTETARRFGLCQTHHHVIYC